MDEIEEGVGALKAKLGRILTKPKVFFAGWAWWSDCGCTFHYHL